MRIGVIGAGWMGGTVGRQWVNAGHEVMFSSRHPEQLQSMVRELGPHATAGMPRQAAEFGEILLFTVPYQALPDPSSVGRWAVLPEANLVAMVLPTGISNRMRYSSRHV